MPEAPEKCPICQSELVITRLYCPTCETTFEGYFRQKPDPFTKLTEEQRDFLLTFIRLEGRLNRMEETLGVSYPTLKNRLTDVIHALGFETEKQPASGSTDRQQILEDLENGLITTEEALELLHSTPKQNR